MFYDVLVIGGGASGLMAAYQAAHIGAKTLLLEKMERPGRKLLITGKGRCNITNIAPLSDFIKHFGNEGKKLRNLFSLFSNDDLIQFFEQSGVKTEVERGGRVFPISDDANDVVTALIRNCNLSEVIIKNRTPVGDFIIDNGLINGIKTSVGEIIKSKVVILATGGASYPATGSTGDGYRLASSVGHKITQILPVLVPIVIEGSIPSKLEGLSLKNVNASIWENDHKLFEEFGEMLFTGKGVSGPIILTLSRNIVTLLNNEHQLILSIDFKPALDDLKLDERLIRDFNENGKMQFKNLLKLLLPQKIIPVFIELMGISPEKLGNQISAKERKFLRKLLKDFRLNISGHGSFKEAIITRGGISLSEIDLNFMASKIIPNLFFAGEVIDIDGETGGFNLQFAFSSGWLAGKSAAEYCLKN
jgi:predicted Rossmann fold flavoprotein